MKIPPKKKKKATNRDNNNVTIFAQHVFACIVFIFCANTSRNDFFLLFRRDVHESNGTREKMCVHELDFCVERKLHKNKIKCTHNKNKQLAGGFLVSLSLSNSFHPFF